MRLALAASMRVWRALMLERGRTDLRGATCLASVRGVGVDRMLSAVVGIALEIGGTTSCSIRGGSIGTE